MNPTKSHPASIFYAEYLLPLRLANARENSTYLDQESGRPSYWSGIATRTGGFARIDPSHTDVAALLEAIGNYWQQQGESRLMQLLPDLTDLHRQLTDKPTPQDENGGRVIDYTYPLF